MTKYIIAILVSLLTLSSCTEDFEAINTNPNGSEDINPEFLLANVISEVADQNTYDQGFRLANYLTQFAASVEFERIDRYEMGTNSNYWDNLYGLLADVKSMQTSAAANTAYIAVGDVMRSYIYSQLTDMWGDVPYSQALRADEGITTPVYDDQQAIYTDADTGIIATLRRAAATLSSTTDRIEGDVLYGGDLDRWVRLANALQVRYTLRISKRLSDFSELQALADGGTLLRSNADNAVLPYLAAAPNQWPMSQASQGLYQEHRMTTTVLKTLSDWQDPRIDILYKPSENSLISGSPAYGGLQNGLSRETISATGIDLNDISLFGAIYRDVADGVDAQIMQYAEQQFALAEAVTRGYITGDATALYQSAIAAHYDYLGVALPADYLAQPAIQLDGSDDLTKILTQKWVCLISNGHEAWFNIRRTSIPALIPGPDNLNDNRYPTRYLYPESEQATNAVNYAIAVERIGADDINTKNWWER